MEQTKYKIAEKLTFVFLAIYPFGQLLNYEPFPGVRIHLIDFIGIVFLLFNLEFFKKNWIQIVSVSFGSLVFIKSFNFEFFIGFLYYVRLLSYLSFSMVLVKLVKLNKKFKKLLLNSLFLISLFVSFLGWIQYLFLPDVRWLKIFGWDDHLYRMIGTFLDPGFLGIILTLAFLLSLFYYLKEKQRRHFFLSIILLFSVAFTYSRASFLSLVVGTLIAGFVMKNIKKSMLFVLLFGGLIFFLPRPSSEGVKLERIYSIDSRIENYKTTYQIFKQNPLFGVGFNNLCSYKNNFLNIEKKFSHSCSGSDSSILFLFATTGIVGVFLIFKIIKDFVKRLAVSDFQTKIFLVSFFALFVHSQFTNSLFYPWVMGWFAILGSSLRIKFKS